MSKSGFSGYLDDGKHPVYNLFFGYLDDGKHPVNNLVFLDDI